MRQLPLIILFIIAVFFITGIVIGSRMQLSPVIATSDKPTYSNTTPFQPSSIPGTPVASIPGTPDKPTEAPFPTLHPTDTIDTVQPNPIQSGGLGLLRTDWEAIHGQPTKAMLDVFGYENNMAIVFQHDQVWEIEQSWNDQSRSLEEARMIAQAMLPSDSILIETYLSGTGQVVDLYNSKYLLTRFPGGPWINSNPGDHIISYLHEPDQQEVRGVVISIGNAP